MDKYIGLRWVLPKVIFLSVRAALGSKMSSLLDISAARVFDVGYFALGSEVMIISDDLLKKIGDNLYLNPLL